MRQKRHVISRPWWDQDWFKGLLLAAAVLLVYQRVWHAGFIWDDDDHLTRNSCVVGPAGLWDIWTSSAARICPLVLTSFWVQHAIWGLDPLPYHLFTLLMHAGAAVVLWRVMLRLNVPGSWLGAALWALHPVQVESVAWITELKNTQSGLFFMLAALFFVRARQAEQAQDAKRMARNDWVAFGFGALAMASKSSTVVLPLVLGLCAWWVQRGWRWSNALRLAPYVLLSIVSSVLSIWTQRLEGAAGSEWTRSFLERVIVAGKVVWFYLGKLVWPHPLIFIYPKWQIDARQVSAYLPSALVLVVLMLLWHRRQRWGRSLFFAFAFFLAALLPVLGIVNHYFLRYSFVGDHFQYLASIGPLALAGAGFVRVPKLAGGRNDFTRWVASGLLLGGLGLMTWQQCGMYADEETLWRTTIAKNPNCWIAQSNLGGILVAQGNLDEAVQHCQKAIQLEPNCLQAHNNWGIALARQGKLDEAIQHFRRALELKPDLIETYSNLGTALAKRGELTEAVQRLQQALELALAQQQPILAEDIRARLDHYQAMLPRSQVP